MAAADAMHERSFDPDGGHGSQEPLPGADPRPVTAAYVHLPFCKRKCFYCDFPVVAVGTAGANGPAATQRFTDYLGLLLREIAATRRVGPPAKLSTVFFGGGTPSLIPPALLSEVLDALRRGFGITEGAEISMEADPGTGLLQNLRGCICKWTAQRRAVHAAAQRSLIVTSTVCSHPVCVSSHDRVTTVYSHDSASAFAGTFDVQRLREYMALGVNRFSVGVQASSRPSCSLVYVLPPDTGIRALVTGVNKAGVTHCAGLPAASAGGVRPVPQPGRGEGGAGRGARRGAAQLEFGPHLRPARPHARRLAGVAGGRSCRRAAAHLRLRPAGMHSSPALRPSS